MGIYETKYETRDGKTYRVEEFPPALAEEQGQPAAPKTNAGADNNQPPGKPAKEGA